jgi:TRAP-type C4-dicarboxylate transport system permease small subunit
MDPRVEPGGDGPELNAPTHYHLVTDRLLKWLEWPIQIFLWIALFAGFLMMLHVSADVSGRYFFGRPIEGTTEVVSAYYMVVVAYLPWAYLSRNDTHIAVDIFTRLMPMGFAHWLDVVVKVVVALYLVVFIYQTGSQAINQTRIHEVWQAGTTYIPVWPSRWVPPVAASLMLLYLVVKILDDIIKGPQPKPAQTLEEGA